jgi:hypothetical protein
MYVKKESWYEIAMQEASRGIFKGSKSSKKHLSEMAGLDFCSKGAADQVDWRATMVTDLVAKKEPPSSGGSTFLAMRC